MAGERAVLAVVARANVASASTVSLNTGLGIYNQLHVLVIRPVQLDGQ